MSLENVDEGYLTLEGGVDVSRLSDCNLFRLRDFARAAGFANPRHFRDNVLKNPDSPFHCYEEHLRDDSGHPVASYFATHVNSAEAGGRMWRQLQTKAAAQRARVTDPSSGSSR